MLVNMFHHRNFFSHVVFSKDHAVLDESPRAEHLFRLFLIYYCH